MGQGKTIYSVETYSHTLEVFGEPDMGWYGWALVRDDQTVAAHDQDAGYGSFHVALREGLNAAKLLED